MTARRYVLRPPRAGDLGWIVERHGTFYWTEYGWDERFEAIVARIVADFVDHYDAARERCWIAELDGVNVGSVMLVKESDTVARLRLLLVNEEARGMGLGLHLVQQCIAFARRAGYDAITLWTTDAQVAARRIYAGCGFEQQSAVPNATFDPF